MVLEIPQGWIAQRRVFGKLSAAAIEAVYVALRAVAIDGDETVEQYDAAVQQRVEIHFSRGLPIANAMRSLHYNPKMS